MDASERENRRSTFEDLEVYQVAREFRKAKYRVARRLPDIEKFALTNQIRRAAVSLTNNIAEAHGRYHYLDQIKFLWQSRGSLQELIDDLNVCMDECATRRILWAPLPCEKRRQPMSILRNWMTIHDSRFNESR
jgi:four helix bundle protein